MGIVVRVTVAEAARDLPGLLDRMRVQGISFEIADGDRIVARLEPPQPGPSSKVCTMADLVAALRRLPPLSEEDSLAWERELAEIRRNTPMQIREWD